MIFIKKDVVPEYFEDMKNKYPNLTWDKFSKDEKLRTIKSKLRNSILKEQGYVCCFCGRRIKQSTSRISHILPRSKHNTKEFLYCNLMCSCDTTNLDKDNMHCDARQGNKTLSIAPTQEDCLTYFSFMRNGEIRASSEKSNSEQRRAEETINILNLNSANLTQKRYSLIKQVTNILKGNKETGYDYLRKFSKRNEKDEFEPFYFVVLKYFNFKACN